MAGPRQPTDLVLLNGRKHMTKAEENARRECEVRVEPPAQISPPKWLPKKLHGEFREIGDILSEHGLYTELDRDALGQFLLSRDRWLRADKLASAAIRSKDEKLAKEWTSTQSAYFRQCRQCAEVLGLSVSSRCRLALPQDQAGREDAEEDDFTRRLRARQARSG